MHGARIPLPLILKLAFESTSWSLAGQPLAFTVADTPDRSPAVVAAVPSQVAGAATLCLVAAHAVAKR